MYQACIIFVSPMKEGKFTVCTERYSLIFSDLEFQNDTNQPFTQKQKVMVVAAHYFTRMNCLPCGVINVKSKFIRVEISAEGHK